MYSLRTRAWPSPISGTSSSTSSKVSGPMRPLGRSFSRKRRLRSAMRRPYTRAGAAKRELELEPRVGFLEGGAEELAQAPQPVAHGLRVQVQLARRAGD